LNQDFIVSNMGTLRFHFLILPHQETMNRSLCRCICVFSVPCRMVLWWQIFSWL